MDKKHTAKKLNDFRQLRLLLMKFQELIDWWVLMILNQTGLSGQFSFNQ